MNKKLLETLEYIYEQTINRDMSREKRIHMVASYIMTVLVNILPDQLKDEDPSITMPKILKEMENISNEGIAATDKWSCYHE